MTLEAPQKTTLVVGESVRCIDPDNEWYKHPPQSMVVGSTGKNGFGEEIAVLRVTWSAEVRVLASDFEPISKASNRVPSLAQSGLSY